MKNLSKEQEAKRDAFLARMIESGKVSKDDVDRMMSDPAMRKAINALCATSK